MSYSNYIIFFKNESISRTYNGMTNNLHRRFRQHNCIIKGGAVQTSRVIKKFPAERWKPIAIFDGFPDKSEAMRAEWRIRYPENKRKKGSKYSGPEGRIRGINYILENSDKWTQQSDIILNQNLILRIDKVYYDLLNKEACAKHKIKIEIEELNDLVN